MKLNKNIRKNTRKNKNKKKGFSHAGTRRIAFLLHILSKLPVSWLHFFANRLGSLLFLLQTQKRKIAKINIGLCFPQLDRQEINTMTHQSFRNFCFGTLWGLKIFNNPMTAYTEATSSFSGTGQPGKKKPARFVQKITWNGEEQLKTMLAENRRVVVLSAHTVFTDVICWALGCRHLGSVIGTYKTSGNAVFDSITDNRKKYAKALLKTTDVHRIRKTFAGGDILWLAVDQDSPKISAVYAPFLGVPAASPVAGRRWAGIMGAEAFVMHGHCFTGLCSQN